MALTANITAGRSVRLAVPIAVAGTGIYLPPRVVTNTELAATLDTSDEWIISRTGIRERRWLGPDQAVSDMAVAAARHALQRCGQSAASLDAIIVASYTPDQPLPSTALLVKDQLGAGRALPLDITQAACANGLQAMLVAAHLLQVSAESVLVVAADCASRVTDPADRTTRVFFGDAAAAVVLTRSTNAQAGLLAWDFGSQLSHAVAIPAGGSRLPPDAATVQQRQHFLQMDGRAVWDMATEWLPQSVAAAVARAGLPVSGIDHFFLHQANLNILSAALAKLGVPPDRAPVTVDRLGNTGSAGAFTALHSTCANGQLRPGDTYVLSAIGAGFQWGTLCLRHG